MPCCEPEQIRSAVRNFQAVEHRLESWPVRRRDYYNGLQGHERRLLSRLGSLPRDDGPHVHLILGGKAKGRTIRAQ